ncbi:MAG: DUF4105 domain-containing protein, partial [Deltaproteobacteria bacterium]|nr:DUF4105 domain-containing protein [Deltaproteobacteria bacterium]
MPRMIIAALLVLTAPLPALADRGGRNTDDPIRVHVLTMGQGEELFTRFGHIALMVDYPGGRRDRVYNFGTFAFDDPDLRIKYARGFLTYWLDVDSFPSVVLRYKMMDRD